LTQIVSHVADTGVLSPLGNHESHVPFSPSGFAPAIAEIEIIGVRERCEAENRRAIPLEDDEAWRVAITR
jgi:hypothetical protein